jgi:hypothetical protein
MSKKAKKAPKASPKKRKLSPEDLEKVSGGAPRDPQSGLPTGQRIHKPI